jgi:hypothetical protein
MPRFGGVTDFLPLPLVLVQEQRPGARFFTLQTLMPESDQPRFHINYSVPHECPVSHIGNF